MKATEQPKVDQTTLLSISLPPHLIAMGNEPWALWKLLAVRATGFPILELLKLAMPACATAADYVITQTESTNHEQEQSLQEAWDSFQQAFNSALVQTSVALYEVSQRPDFQEAVVWQNRQAFHNMIKRLIRPPSGTVNLHYRNSQQRRREEVTAMYWQRYCTKNETIGFFGPAGWGKFTPEGSTIRVMPGPHLLTKRRVYFEEWGISLLARKLSQEKKLRPWIAPSRHPMIYAGATSVHLPSLNEVTFSSEELAILQLCDGLRLAREIAVDLASQMDEETVFNCMESLDAQGFVSWNLRIPIETNPDEILRALLHRIEDDAVREPALNELAELEQARTTVAQAAGNPEQLDRALTDLENAFIQLTGEEATRLSGKMFVGRTLVYEDCVRDLDVQVGPELRSRLAGPLALFFASARWFSWQLAGIYRDLFQKLYNEAVEQTGARTIPVLAIWKQLASFLFPGQPLPGLQDLCHELQRNWAAILGMPSSQHRLNFTTTELRSQVLNIFGAPGPGWKTSRYASVDILVDAADVHAIQRGEYQLVIGDFHATNPLRQPFHLYQHPDLTAIERDYIADLPGGQFIPVLVSGGPFTPRVSYGIRRPDDVWLRMTPDGYVNPRAQTLDVGEMLLEDLNGMLMVRSRDGQVSIDPLAVFEFAPLVRMLHSFLPFGSEIHTPRITIDSVVIHRETWCIPISSILFASEKDEARRYVAARRWARDYELPRFIFVKMPHGDKPFYVDLDSPVLVNILAKEIRHVQEEEDSDSRIVVMEMVPMPDGAWLPDIEGQRYTSELRIVALDLSHFDSDSI